jgi:TonB family protein
MIHTRRVSAYVAAGMLAVATALAAAVPTPATAEPPPNVPWKVHQTVPAVFPPRLLQRGVRSGIVLVRASVLETGKLADALAIAATDREFADEALRVIRLWRFDPARMDGHAIGIVGTVSFRFLVGGTVAVDLRAGDNLPRFGPQSTFVYRAVELKELDGVPAPVHVVQPIYPQAWADSGLKGSATIEYYIDESGRTRMPAIVTATDDRLGAVAAAAVAEWRFDPPLRGGAPALVRIEQDFHFEPPLK